MKLVTALAVVIGILGVVATYLFAGPASTFGPQIWVAFIAWASFFGAGGTNEALVKSLAANLWGAVWATIALVLAGKFGGGGAPIVAAIVGGTCCLMILGAHFPLLGVIPAQVYGYAATAGFGLLTGASGLDFSLGKGPFTTVAVSLIVGAGFGYLTGVLAGKLVPKPA
ncbi:conserved membrane hypothetical protein [Mesorhizobium plurifarium]|uniref:DUF1097 domain-containing protein n=1 Tax=Mesorhizobium plurifarium TaxID=69974 RepID=A0A0K2VQ10_MESPL|nr:conserved membrane hypothetical protein [Mesorhizobium plurifarium]